MKIDKKVRELYPDETIDYDEMADDIFDQIDPAEQEYATEIEEPYFPVSNEAEIIKPVESSLMDLESYNMTDEQEDDFDIAYRTPNNIDVTDLLPVDYRVGKRGDSGLEDAFADYDPVKDEISVREKDWLIKENDIVSPFEKQHKMLVHENIHRQWWKQYDIDDDKTKLKPKRMLNETDSMNKEDLMYDNTASMKQRQEYLDEFNGIFDDLGTTADKKQVKKLRNEIYKREYGVNALNEGYAYYGALRPERILNPQNKTDRKLNRMFFQ